MKEQDLDCVERLLREARDWFADHADGAPDAARWEKECADFEARISPLLEYFYVPVNSAAERLAQQFHEAYERLAPAFSYETNPATRKAWGELPARNRRLMVAVCAEILNHSRPVWPITGTPSRL